MNLGDDFHPLGFSPEAMRHAEQFESESAVWQVKNAPG